MLDIIPREEARAAGLKHYFTGEPCVNGHVDRRYVVSNACCECNLERSRRYRERNPELCATRVAAAMAKAPDYFKDYYRGNRDRRKAEAKGWYTDNRERHARICKKWVEENRDKRRKIGLLSARKRRAKKAAVGGTHTQADLDRIFRLQRGKCAICKCSLSKAAREVDHIIPISRGGHNGPGNLQYLCRPCNRAKAAKDPLEFAQERGLLV